MPPTPRFRYSSLSDPDTYSNEQGFFGQFSYQDAPKLEAIFFAEFDNTRGPVITYQIPKEVITKERFDQFSAAIITKPELLYRLIKITFHDYKIMGHPIIMEHPSYNRGQRIFNMCFVVAKQSTVDCMYEPLVQKCAEYLVELEQECGFLNDENHRAKLPEIMKTIFHELNNRGECVTAVTELTRLILKLCPSYRGIEPPKVTQFMVPMFLRQVPLDKQIIDKMDVLSQKIIPKIDGVRCVKEISSKSETDIDLVINFIRNLHFYESVSLVPLFMYTNTYVATEKVHDFYQNKEEIKECLEFVRIRNTEENKYPIFSDVFRLYLSLRCSICLREWCEEMRPRNKNVDEQRLIQFGLHHGFLRKLSIYPISIARSEMEKLKILDKCNGTKALEDLAVEYGMMPDEMHEILKKSGKFAFISK